MAKGRYQYFPVIQNSEKAKFNKSYVFLSQREWTDPNGLFRPARCLSIKPNANGMYVVDMDDKEMSALKIAVLTKTVAAGTDPVIGPFDSVEAAIIGERKVRPMTEKEELESLRREKAERESKPEPKPERK